MPQGRRDEKGSSSRTVGAHPEKPGSFQERQSVGLGDKGETVKEGLAPFALHRTCGCGGVSEELEG